MKDIAPNSIRVIEYVYFKTQPIGKLRNLSSTTIFNRDTTDLRILYPHRILS